MKNMVIKAWHEHYALLIIDRMNLESAHAAIRVAEKSRVPTILNLYQGHLVHFPAPAAAAVAKTFMESASVSVALALDHGKNPNCIRQALRAGSSGSVIDAPAFPPEENVRQTRVMMELATGAQLYVEDELGHLADAPRYDQAANADLMAQPTDVEPSIVQIGIDLLVVSVGTAYGMYVPGVVPVIDFQHLAETFHCLSVSLVLHGSSGTPFDQLQLCATLGVTKINVGVAILERGKSVLLHTLYHDISVELVDAPRAMELVFGETITPYLQASGTIGKA